MIVLPVKLSMYKNRNWWGQNSIILMGQSKCPETGHGHIKDQKFNRLFLLQSTNAQLISQQNLCCNSNCAFVGCNKNNKKYKVHALK